MRLLVCSALVLVVGLLGCDGKEQPEPSAGPSRLEEAQIEQTKVELQRLRNAADMYWVQTSKCPTSVAELIAAEILPSGGVEDPWGNQFVLTCPGQHDDIDIASPGKDRELGTSDDINSWTQR